MLMYHGTTAEKWAKIQEEGVLWGVRNAPSRCTYLAALLVDAKGYGDIVLEVDFDPKTDTPNNFHPDSWQCRVYVPIPLNRVKTCMINQ